MTPTTPIDVEPIGQSSNRDASRRSHGDASAPPDGTRKETTTAATPDDARETPYQAPHYGSTRSTAKRPSKVPGRVGGAIQLAAGCGIALVGIPMLVLPGPGLLAIGGGAVLAVNGAKRLMGR